VTDEQIKKEKKVHSNNIPHSDIVDPFDTDRLSSHATSSKGDVNKIEKTTKNVEAQSALQQAIDSLSKKEQQSNNSYNELLKVAPMLLVTGLLLFGVAFATSYKPVGNIISYGGSHFITKTNELAQYASLAATFGASLLVQDVQSLRNDTPLLTTETTTLLKAGQPVVKNRIKILPSSFSLDVMARVVQKQMAAVAEAMHQLFTAR
jgi:hypothetical protein